MSKKLQNQKTMNDALLLLRMFLNHSTTACEFFHWLNCTEEIT